MEDVTKTEVEEDKASGAVEVESETTDHTSVQMDEKEVDKSIGEIEETVQTEKTDVDEVTVTKAGSSGLSSLINSCLSIWHLSYTYRWISI